MDAMDFDKVLGSQPTKLDGWRRYGLLKNPFPSRAHPIWDVFYNQDPVRGRFLTELRTFVADGKSTTLFFTGGNRVGKTHFMEHYRRILPKELCARGLTLPIALTSAQFCDFRQFYGQLIEQIDDSLQLQTGSHLFGQEIPVSHLKVISDALPGGDFRRAIMSYAGAIPSERANVSLWLRKWIRGERLRMPQRQLLDVTESIDSTGQLLNVIDGLVKYLREVPFNPGKKDNPRCPGILVFVDEFELVWKHRRDRRDQFLQSLRASVDACPTGLFLCVGMATGMGVEMNEVESSYPALFQRLRGHLHRDIPALLQVGNVLDAIGYAREFLAFGKKESLSQGFKDSPEPLSEGDILTDKEIQSLFIGLAGRAGSVSQGDYFDRLHEVAEARANGTPIKIE